MKRCILAGRIEEKEEELEIYKKEKANLPYERKYGILLFLERKFWVPRC
jgi:hypothetical protein